MPQFQRIFNKFPGVDMGDDSNGFLPNRNEKEKMREDLFGAGGEANQLVFDMASRFTKKNLSVTLIFHYTGWHSLEPVVF